MSRDSFPFLTNNNSKTALVDGDRDYSFEEVNGLIDRFASGLLRGSSDLNEERIAFFIPASVDYVTAMHGVWRAGGISIPLNVASAV